MVNSAFINEQARVLAAFLRQRAGDDPAACVRLALWRTLQREPAPGEIARGVRFITALEKEDGVTPSEALRYFCLVALNLNEFIYLD